MPFTITKQYPHGTFCWADVMSTDEQKSSAFYSKVMGWRVQHTPEDGGTDFYLGEHVVAGANQMPAMMKNIPSFWQHYVAVDDVAEMVEKAKKLGAQVVLSPTQVIDAGWVATIIDPQGAELNLWQAMARLGATLVNTAGAMGWNELLTKDIAAAKDFYGKLFGWTFEDGDNSGYWVIKNNGRMNGAAMQLTEEMAMPSSWLVYFTVENLEKTIAAVKENGGTVVMLPKKSEDGSMVFSLIADPTGAHNYFIELIAVGPEEWVE